MYQCQFINLNVEFGGAGKRHGKKRTVWVAVRHDVMLYVGCNCLYVGNALQYQSETPTPDNR